MEIGCCCCVEEKVCQQWREEWLIPSLLAWFAYDGEVDRII